MSNGGEDYKYRIKVEGDIAAAPQAEKAIKQVTHAAKEMRKEAEQSAKRLEQYFRQAAKEAAFLEKASREAQRAGAFTAGDFTRAKTKGRVGQAFDAFRDAGGGMGGIRAGLGALGGRAAVVGGATLAAAAAAASVTAKALHEYASAQERVASLDSALAQRGQLTDGYREALQKLAQTQQELTSIESSKWLEAFTTLTQAGAGPENINKVVEATKNYAGLMGGDLQSAAFAVGKALNGQFDAFTRLGIVVDENATQAKKFEQVCEQLAKRGGGQLEAQIEGLTGAFRTLKNSSSDLLQGLGGIYAKATNLDRSVRQAAGAISWLSSLFSSTQPKAKSLKNAVIETGAAMESKEEIVRRHAKAYETLKAAAGQAATEMGRAQEAIRAKLQQENDLAGAKADAQLKKIDQDEASGRITPTRAAELRTQVRKNQTDGNFRREKEARDKEIGLIGGRADSIRSQVDAANKKVADEKAKLEEMKKLQERRTTLVETGRAGVELSTLLYEQAKGPDRKVAKKEMLLRRYTAQRDVAEFDATWGKIDVAGQEEKFKQAKEFAKKINQELYPQQTDLIAKKIAMQQEQSAAMRKHGWVSEANRLDSIGALQRAREEERGQVQRNPDGSLSVTGGTRSGQAAAISVERQSAALAAATPNLPIGSRGDQVLVAQRDRQIAHLQSIVEALSNLSQITPAMEIRLRAALDRIAVLEAQNRNRSNR